MGAAFASCLLNQAEQPTRRHFFVKYGNRNTMFTMRQYEVTLQRLIERCIAQFDLQGSFRIYELTTQVDQDIVVLSDDALLKTAIDVAAARDKLARIKLQERTWGATDDNLLMQTTEPVKKHNRLASKTPGTMSGA